MAIDLLNLEPQRISRNLRGKYLCIYSLPGVGKTTLASKFNKVLIASFEPGTNALNNVYVQPVKTWTDWRQMVSQLSKKKELQDKFEVIAMDTVDEAWNLCTKWICSQNSVESLKEIPWGDGYAQATKEFSQTLRDLAYSGYGLIFISHSTEKAFKNEKGEEYTQIVPALPNRPFDIINKMVDIIAYIREISVGTEDNPQRKRFMFLRDTVGDRFLAKSRYQYITPKIELNYEALVNAIYNAIDEEIKHSGGAAPSEEQSPYFEKNFDELMEDAKAIWIQATKENKIKEVTAILEKEFGKAIKFSEILPEQIEQLNNVLLEIRDIM